MTRLGAELVAEADTAVERLVVSDVAIVADFSDSETAWRIESDVQTQFEWGYRTALIPVNPGLTAEAMIQPDIAACVREGLAVAVNPAAQAVRARLVVVYQPERLFAGSLSGR